MYSNMHSNMYSNMHVFKHVFKYVSARTFIFNIHLCNIKLTLYIYIYVCVCVCVYVRKRFVIIFVVIDSKTTSNSLKKIICEIYLRESFARII